MNYKKIFKTRETRIQILKMLSFIPDKTMLKLQYRIKMNRKLNLENPILFTEKMQWYKLYYRKKILRVCADKAAVRKYLKKLGLSDILVPLVGVYKRVEEIDFDSLPDGIVFKDTLGGGGNSVIMCDSIVDVNLDEVKCKLKCWLRSDISYKTGGREWQYGGGTHRIIIEKKLKDENEHGSLIDYKIHCFNGKPTFIQCIGGRDLKAHTGYQKNFDFEWKDLGWTFGTYPDFPYEIPKPKLLDEMYAIASEISSQFPYVRVDLYQVDEKIYFGEMTFVPGSGYYPYYDRWTEERDLELGEKIKFES